MSSLPTEALERQRLRWQLYNATLVSVRRAHEELAVFRVRGDRGRPELEPGQYTLLGLGNWESGVGLESFWPSRPALIRRPYSASCALVAATGDLVRLGDREELEFYVALVSDGGGGAASLTPRLFALGEGGRLFLGPHAKGRYTLAPVRPDDDVIFCATGTGEAPHNAMIAELLGRGHRGRIASAVSVRQRRDLAYAGAHRVLESRFANYRYVPLTTREPCNLEPACPAYVGKRYLQDVFGDDSSCQEAIGFVPRPGRARFFLCGSPAMIGLPRRRPDGGAALPAPRGMVEVLCRRGFRLDEPHVAGDIHCEKYW